MENALLLAALATLASKVFELIKRVKAKDANGSVSILGVWIAGVLAVVLAAHAKVFELVAVPGTSIVLGNLDGASQIFLGLTLTSFISLVVDFKSAFDQSDSAVQPKLLAKGPQTPPNP